MIGFSSPRQGRKTVAPDASPGYCAEINTSPGRDVRNVDSWQTSPFRKLVFLGGTRCSQVDLCYSDFVQSVVELLFDPRPDISSERVDLNVMSRP